MQSIRPHNELEDEEAGGNIAKEELDWTSSDDDDVEVNVAKAPPPVEKVLSPIESIPVQPDYFDQLEPVVLKKPMRVQPHYGQTKTGSRERVNRFAEEEDEDDGSPGVRWEDTEEVRERQRRRREEREQRKTEREARMKEKKPKAKGLGAARVTE